MPENMKLEVLLNDLFASDDEVTSDDVTALSWPINPILLPILTACCSWSYTYYTNDE